jgi:hypothetical protein
VLHVLDFAPQHAEWIGWCSLLGLLPFCPAKSSFGQTHYKSRSSSFPVEHNDLASSVAHRIHRTNLSEEPAQRPSPIPPKDNELTMSFTNFFSFMTPPWPNNASLCSELLGKLA